VKSSLHLVLIEEGSDRILGAHIVGPYTEEQINTSALAIQRGITSQNLKEIIFAYLTGSSDISSSSRIIISEAFYTIFMKSHFFSNE
jgi:pyruvate/2-oxoglutarate dehydrogenase complex dihydrolipoamide dehydrogenase (E3) component